MERETMKASQIVVFRAALMPEIHSMSNYTQILQASCGFASSKEPVRPVSQTIVSPGWNRNSSPCFVNALSTGYVLELGVIIRSYDFQFIPWVGRFLY